MKHSKYNERERDKCDKGRKHNFLVQQSRCHSSHGRRIKENKWHVCEPLIIVFYLAMLCHSSKWISFGYSSECLYEQLCVLWLKYREQQANRCRNVLVSLVQICTSVAQTNSHLRVKDTLCLIGQFGEQETSRVLIIKQKTTRSHCCIFPMKTHKFSDLDH